jgi:hypothetical protein
LELEINELRLNNPPALYTGVNGPDAELRSKLVLTVGRLLFCEHVWIDIEWLELVFSRKLLYAGKLLPLFICSNGVSLFVWTYNTC